MKLTRRCTAEVKHVPYKIQDCLSVEVGEGEGCRYWFGWRAQVRWQVIPSHRLQLCFVVFFRLHLFFVLFPQRRIWSPFSRRPGEPPRRRLDRLDTYDWSATYRDGVPLLISTLQANKVEMDKIEKELTFNHLSTHLA